MSRDRSLPACYAMVHPGLEEVAAEEIRTEIGGDLKRSSRGIVLFRLDDIDRSILSLRTTEDVYLHAWGTDALSFRATDLESIRRWTAKDADWTNLLRIHHAIRPKPKGKPTFRLVVQMTGIHGYRRMDARKSLLQGLAGKFPASWRAADEDANIEVWLTINEDQAVCGLRLSDKTMRQRTWKFEHFPASLRPTMAAAMVRLANLKPNQVVLDPMCGAGTLLAEAFLYAQQQKRGGPDWNLTLKGGDIDPHHVKFAKTNLRQFADVPLQTWDARKLPVERASVDRILCNLPFGKQMSSPEEIGPLYQDAVWKMHRVLKPGGKAVLLVADAVALKNAIASVKWKQEKFVPVRVLGQRAVIMVYRTPPAAERET